MTPLPEIFPPSPGMAEAILQARAAAARGEIPVGAAITDPHGHILAADGNRTIAHHDPTAHAEMLVLRAACKIVGNFRLTDCDLYVTLEPCPMCATAISFARIRRLYYAAPDPKSGGINQGPRIYTHPTCHHRPEIFEGIARNEASTLLRDFFKTRRKD